MEGDPIAHVRAALSLFVHSLPPVCEFDIVSFGSSFSSLFGEKRAYSDATMRAALADVRAMDADMFWNRCARSTFSF
jgi:hypothetical protein